MEAILKEYERLERTGSFAKCEKRVDALLELLEQAQAKVDGQPDDAQEQVRAILPEAMKLQKDITDAEKEVYNGIAKFGRALEKTFKPTFLSPENGDNAKPLPISPGTDLNTAILMHLSRAGEFNVASKFMEEAHLSVPEDLLEEFAHMYEILQHLLSRNLGPAIEWATSKRADLLARGSNLEFSLHKLQFIRFLIDEGDTNKALAYAQQNLSVFGDRYLNDIAQLMSGVLYVGRIDHSPYRQVFASPSYDDLYDMFSFEFCSFLGLPPDSPLYLAATAGAIAQPVLAKMEIVMKNRGAEWTTKQELPVEIDLPPKFRFHSIFVCPVSKEQTTDRNPPMMLPCGHVLANDSLRSLSNDNPHHTFKCPYCPMDATYYQAKRVYF